MTTRTRTLAARLALALSLVPIAGCFGPSNEASDVSPSSANPAGTVRSGPGKAGESTGVGGQRDPQRPAGPGGVGPESATGADAAPK